MAVNEGTRQGNNFGGVLIGMVVALMLVGAAGLVLSEHGVIAIKSNGELVQPTAIVQTQPTQQQVQTFPTSAPSYQPVPVVYQQVEQQPAKIAIQQPPPQPTAAIENAPEQKQVTIIIHERPEQGQNIVTGNGACDVGGSVARRCGNARP